MFYEAVMARDYPVIMAVTIGGVLTMSGISSRDVAYACADPRSGGGMVAALLRNRLALAGGIILLLLAVTPSGAGSHPTIRCTSICPMRSCRRHTPRDRPWGATCSAA